MDERTAELEAAVRARDALIAEAQGLLTRYLAKKIESVVLIDSLLKLFEGPRQRGAQRLAREAWGGFPQQRLAVNPAIPVRAPSVEARRRRRLGITSWNWPFIGWQCGKGGLQPSPVRAVPVSFR
ncbi:MAG: hypothetical protein WA397_25445 [Roseiarcus sp.]